METELKFALLPGTREAIERAVAADGAEPARHSDVSTYFDTPDLRLHKAGFSLRVRRRSDREGCLQTVKRAGGSGLRRDEWEWTVTDEALDPTLLHTVPGLPPVLDGHADELRPLFRTEVERCQQTLHPAPGATIELAVDEGVIVAGDRREPLSEVELELKDGAEEALFRLGLDLAQAAPLPLLVESKAARGYRLQDGGRPQAHKPADVALDAECPAGEAFARLVDSLLDHLLANQPAALDGDRVEGVHQMRVAVRRLRSLLVLFRPMIERQARRRFDDELRRLGDVLGNARDLDVFLDETLPAALDDGVVRATLEPLRLTAGQQRQTAHQAAGQAASDSGFTRFVLALRAWSRTSAITSRFAERPLGRCAPRLLDRLEDKLDKRLARSDPDDAPSLHAVRKSAKKLRYGIEYFAGLWPDEVDAYLKRCNRLQKRLGALNDLESATDRAGVLAADRIELAPALGALATWAGQRRPQVLAKGLKAERAFARADPFWR